MSFRQIMISEDDSFRSFRTSQIVQYDMEIIDLHIQFCQTIVRQLFPNYPFSINVFQLSVWCSCQPWATIRYFGFKTAVVLKMSATSVPSSSCWRVLFHVVVTMRHFPAHGTNCEWCRVWEYASAARLYRQEVCSCTSKWHISPYHPHQYAHNAIYSVPWWRLSEFVHCRLSTACMDLVVSFFTEVVCGVFVMALCTCGQWHQCS